jgi:nicotinamide-nucleotide amidase
MKCEILSIGSELTSGQNLDTNSQWLSRRLAEVGIAVGWHTTIADDLEANLEAVQIASRRARLLLLTGGLGPTQDDLTREVLARAAGVELVFDQASFDIIAAMFQRRGRPMPERNRVQALFPAGAQPIPNDKGTAPGVWMKLGECVVAAMPGVPNEMYAMFTGWVLPRLIERGLAGDGVLLQRKINTFGVGESAVEEKLLDLTRRGHVPEVGITVSEATISLRILARAATQAEALAQAQPVERLIRERLGDLVFGVDDEELQDALAALLVDRKKTLAVVEGCVTGGLVAERLTTLASSRGWFRGGLVIPSAAAAGEHLGVAMDLIKAHGMASAAVAEALAVAGRQRFGTDLAVSTVGVAGPEDETDTTPVGLVYVGLAWDKGRAATNFSWAGSRPEVRKRTAKMALNRVRLHLLRGERQG